MSMQTDKQALAAVPTLVVGLGKTGLSCVKFLARHGVPVAVTDSRDNPPGLASLRAACPGVQCAVGGFDKQLFAWAQRLLVSPGVSLREPLIAEAQARGVEILGDVELFARLVNTPVVAITGSNGKSTVTTLVGEMCNAAGKRTLLGGNLGRPVLEMLDEPPAEFYVLELSSFQLETTRSLNAAVSVVLNISADHMDRYDDVAAYARAKQGVYHGSGVQVINREDPVVAAMVEPDRRVISFGLDAPSADNYGRLSRNDKLWLARGSQTLLPVRELRISGEHNQANALAALAMGEAIGLPMVSMLEALRQFAGLPHRTQWVAEINGVNWYNDSKGTNVGAAVSAIRGLSGSLVWIAGGQGKGADFSALREALAGKVRVAVLLGQDAEKIAEAIEAVAPIVFVNDMADAVRQAQALAQPGESVLLSPACASFDMFNGFEHRGEVFMAEVRALAGGGDA